MFPILSHVTVPLETKDYGLIWEAGAHTSSLRLGAFLKDPPLSYEKEN